MTELFIQNSNLKYHHQLAAELLQCVKTSGSSQQKSANALKFPKLCHELSTEILTNTYQPYSYHHFAITEPKLREIYAPAFRDRIAQMWIALQLVPIMENQFIDDTYANRKGKGTLAAIAKVQKLMRQPGVLRLFQRKVQCELSALYIYGLRATAYYFLSPLKYEHMTKSLGDHTCETGLKTQFWTKPSWYNHLN